MVNCWKTCLKCLWGNISKNVHRKWAHIYNHSLYNEHTDNKWAINVQAVISCIFKKYNSKFLCIPSFCTIVSNLEINLKAKWERKTRSSYVYERSGPQIESTHISVQTELIKRCSPQWNQYYCHAINSSTQSLSVKAGIKFYKVSLMLHQGTVLPSAWQSCYILYTVLGEPQDISLKLCDSISQIPQWHHVCNHTAV